VIPVWLGASSNGPEFAPKDVSAPWGQPKAKEKDDGIEESDQEAQEGREAYSEEGAQLTARRLEIQIRGLNRMLAAERRFGRRLAVASLKVDSTSNRYQLGPLPPRARPLPFRYDSQLLWAPYQQQPVATSSKDGFRQVILFLLTC